MSDLLQGLEGARHLPSPNWNQRPPPGMVTAVIIHYTAVDLEETLRIFATPEQVSSHYLVDRNGEVCQFVDERHRAWHSGVSSLHGRPNVNDFSIGIDLLYVPELHEGFTMAQYRELGRMVVDIRSRHPVKPPFVVGHEHVSPGRKHDPGPLFDWDRFFGEVYGITRVSPVCR